MPTSPNRFSFPRGARTALAAGIVLLAATALQPARALPLVELTAGIHRIHAELADTDASRMRGLMFRESLEPNHGMLFVFERPEANCMWMRNTLLPLSVAFIADDGSIVNVEEMKAQTDDAHCAARPVRYALEMDGGWFKSHGLRAGSRIQGIAPAARR